MNTMTMKRSVQRPRNLNLLSIRLPVNALVSILHRVTGFILYLLVPLLLWLMQRSLQDPQGYAQVAVLVTHPLAKLLWVGLAWAFAHHFFAGIRHLAMDVHWGGELKKARFSSKLVLVCGALCAFMTLLKVF
ncbi:MAG: succinate dehydrogenase, cytochrome b556 subunit [Methylobacterium sp.]|nr:succinate dehydrogenase, cytochrome b556 subunit [Methylobacterium sp.]